MNQYKIYFYSQSGELKRTALIPGTNLDSVFQGCYERIEQDPFLDSCELIKVYSEEVPKEEILSNKEKFLNLVSYEESGTKEKIHWRIENKYWLRSSQSIALLILQRLDELNWTLHKLSEELNTSFTSTRKFLSGSEDFSLSLLLRIQKVLQLNLLHSELTRKDQE